MGLMAMVVLRVDKGFLGKVILILLDIWMKFYLTLYHKGKAMSPSDILALGVVRDMRVGVWPIGMLVMAVVRVST